MRVVEREVIFDTRKNAGITLVPIGDIHIGHRDVDTSRLQATINYVRHTPNCLAVGMGDYAEAFDFKDERSDPHILSRKNLTPDEQYAEVEDLLTPIKSKLICLLAGNHDYKYWTRHNHDFTDQLAHNLDTEYTGFSAYIRITMRRRVKTTDYSDTHTINIYAHHGWSAARSDGGIVNSIHDLYNKFPGLHLYLMGHTHRLGESLPKVTLWVDEGNRIREWISRYVFTGSYFKGYEPGKGSSYSEARGYSPTAIGSPVIEIRPNRLDHESDDKQQPPFSIRVSTMDWLE